MVIKLDFDTRSFNNTSRSGNKVKPTSRPLFCELRFNTSLELTHLTVVNNGSNTGIQAQSRFLLFPHGNNSNLQLKLKFDN